MLNLKENSLLDIQIFVIIVVAAVTLFGGMDLTVIQFVHAAAGHGPNDDGGTLPGHAVGGVGKRSDGFLGVWSFML